ncbi:hypothetical protein BB560_002676 [Smittium megazygosporum]|nr:hypothetical protein BB560_002676 [Smittium megazygosporum]
MGCSNPHPHGQVWALETVSKNVAVELENQKNYSLASCKSSTKATDQHSCMLCDYVSSELNTSKNQTSGSNSNRIVLENDSFVALVPFWAIWPFETMVLPKAHYSNLCQLLSDTFTKIDSSNVNDFQNLVDNLCSQTPTSSNSQSESSNTPPASKLVSDLASILKRLTNTYDSVFNSSFPYSMGIHQSPVLDHPDGKYFHLHFHFYPPLLRSSTVKKFFVGYEMLGEPQRDISPELAASRLRSVIPRD